jgi:ribosomal-protein-alanine N-acetyltransferase
LDETDEVEIGYLLSHAFWGRGLATEGGRIGLHYGFETLGLDEIIGLVHPDNIASRRVLEKLGMTLTGPAVYFETDLLRYVVTKPDWCAAASTP